MIDYVAARTVAMIVQTGSFEAAAQALHITPSAVSQRVRQLEERLGAVLIDRGTPCTATERGAWLCRHMDHVGLLERALMAHLPGLADAGAGERVTLNIATNADSLGTWFLSCSFVKFFARCDDPAPSSLPGVVDVCGAHGWGQSLQTTVDHTLMRGLGTA